MSHVHTLVLWNFGLPLCLLFFALPCLDDMSQAEARRWRIQACLLYFKVSGIGCIEYTCILLNGLFKVNLLQFSS